MDLPKAADLQALIAALAPGLIILGIRQRFIAGPEPSLQDRAVAYAAVSAVYYAVLNPLVAFTQHQWGLAPWLSGPIEYVALPVVLGAFLGAITSRDLAPQISARLGFQPIHHVPTAWDYTFSRLPGGTFLLVTLSDGSQVGGLYAEGSFSSSSAGERDILIADVWEIGDGEWTQPTTPRSILLCGRDIRTVELMK